MRVLGVLSALRWVLGALLVLSLALAALVVLLRCWLCRGVVLVCCLCCAGAGCTGLLLYAPCSPVVLARCTVCAVVVLRARWHAVVGCVLCRAARCLAVVSLPCTQPKQATGIPPLLPALFFTTLGRSFVISC